MQIKRTRKVRLFFVGESEFYPTKYEWVDKRRREIICTTCEGSGDYYNSMYGFIDKGKCPTCEGTGTIILKRATKSITTETEALDAD